MTISKAAFFDRDGVLNLDTGYAHRPGQIEWVQGAFEAVKKVNAAGYRAFVVTNQAGVARGYYTEETVQALHRWMTEEMARHGAEIGEFVYCPHHPTEGRGEYLKDCNCRKPKPGMLKALIEKHGIDAGASFLVGDYPSDLEAARAAGVEGFLFKGGDLAEFVERILRGRA